MAIDRLRIIHQQWLQEQQALQDAVPRSVERFQILGKLRRLQDEVGTLPSDAQDAFAREFLEGYNAASAEKKKSLQPETASPALRNGLTRLQASYIGSTESSAEKNGEAKKPTVQRKSIYEGCNHEIFLSGNVRAIRRIGEEIHTRAVGKPHDSTVLAEVQRAIGRNKSDGLMNPQQAVESLTRTAKKLFIRLNDNGRHPKWEKPTQAERNLWQEIENIVKTRMVGKILDNDTDPNVLAIKRLVERYVREERRTQELRSGYTKWVDAVFDEALEPQEVLREFVEEMKDWRKRHAQDKQADLKDVPEYKYDMPDQGGLPEIEINRSVFGLFEVKALVGLILANNNCKLQFRGTDLGQFVVSKPLVETLRDHFSKSKSSIPEIQQGVNPPMLEMREKALQKLGALLEGPEDIVKEQTIPLESLSKDEQQSFDKLVQSFLLALRDNSTRLGGGEAFCEFLVADKLVGVTIQAPKSAVPEIVRESIGVWEATPAVAAAIISPNN